MQFIDGAQFLYLGFNKLRLPLPVDDNHDYVVLMVDGVVLMIIAKQEALQIILLY